MTRIVTLSEIGIVKTGKTPSKNNPEFWGNKVGFITPSDFTSSKYVHASRRISQAGVNALRNVIIPRSSVLVTCIGSDMGKVARVEEENVITNQQINTLIVNASIADVDFIYYSLKAKYELLRNLGVGGGSTMPIINKTTFEKIKIELPNLETQKKIADILSSLDEKIELNRRMNETLEQLGQTLFRHYFIDNPDAKNWKKRSLGEFFPVKTGKKDANFGTKDGRFPFFTCAQTISRAPSYSFDGSAILIAGNGDFNIKYYTGKFEAYQRTYVLIPHNEELLGFLYFLMKKDLSLITGGSRGSVIKFITKGMIENYRVELPDDNDLAAFAPIFSELLALISHSNEQIQTLAALRDALLLKLISGEIKI